MERKEEGEGGEGGKKCDGFMYTEHIAVYVQISCTESRRTRARLNNELTF